jgi:hypothetical protein
MVIKFCSEKNIHFTEDYDYDSNSNLRIKKFPNGFIMKPVLPSFAKGKMCCVSVTAPTTYVSLCCLYQKNPKQLASVAIIIHRVLEHGVPLTVPFREFHSKKQIDKGSWLKSLGTRLKRKKRY